MRSLFINETLISTQWLSNYSNQVCTNSLCFNAGVSFAAQVNDLCPKDYIGMFSVKTPVNTESMSLALLNSDEKTNDIVDSALKVIYANATAWITPITQSFVDKFPICTRDITNEVCFILWKQI